MNFLLLAFSLFVTSNFVPNYNNSNSSINNATFSQTTQLMDTILKKELARVHIVIVGKVIDVKRASVPLITRDRPWGRPPPMADWHTAIIELETILKGVELTDVQSESITVYFSNSTGDFWRNTPKLELGQRGIFLVIDRTGASNPADLLEFDPEAKTVLGSLYFQPMDQLEKIRNLLSIN